MNWRTMLRGGFCLLISQLSAADTPLSELQQQVWDTETAFAATMAARDLDAFGGFLAEEAIFFSGARALRGKQQVVEAWKGLYQQVDAPFSWEPEQVEVLDSGTLALSTGPVRDATGNVVGRFNSIWRREPTGVWRIVFDKGSDVCSASEK